VLKNITTQQLWAIAAALLFIVVTNFLRTPDTRSFDEINRDMTEAATFKRSAASALH
jgi:hypothetical protein